MHLRWNYQCAGAAAEIHNFPEKRRKVVTKDGTVLDRGTVKLTYSDPGEPGGPKQAFLEGFVLPLSHVIQAVLLSLPLHLRKRALPNIDLDLYGLNYSYVSLNIF